MTNAEELRISDEFCNCGTPDPLNEGHTEDCPAQKLFDKYREEQRDEISYHSEADYGRYEQMQESQARIQRELKR